MSEGHDRRGVDNDHGYRRRSSAGRKDRRRWCRGRVGVEHALTTQYPPNLAGWVVQRPGGLCGPSRHYLWSRERWTCHHAIMCTVCGRIMREYLGTDCPLYDADAVAAMMAQVGEDDDGADAHLAEHWPRTWVVVPVQVAAPGVVEVDGRAGVQVLAPAPGDGDDVELWFPDGCTCGAPTPCGLLDAGTAAGDAQLTSMGTPT